MIAMQESRAAFKTSRAVFGAVTPGLARNPALWLAERRKPTLRLLSPFAPLMGPRHSNKQVPKLL